ncbi:hypothetical protein [Nonlabens sp.]|jgi:hypothetical protein|uniref:hypothetical protein n=1 Tax=Nonlabens sp. TaxID=1888209 RepID=UPI0025F1894A|nr:hypothetical protein [Nonlabens sp.]
MKNLQSTIEGTWIELKPIQLTGEQKTLLNLNEGADKEAVKALLGEIRASRGVTAQEGDIALAEAKYKEVKPTLKGTDVYQLISFNIGGNGGILNCRVNREHRQIRF